MSRPDVLKADERSPHAELLDSFQRVLSVLSPSDADLLRLLIEGKSRTEMAASLGLSTAAVYQRIHRVREKCRAITFGEATQGKPSGEVREVAITQELRDWALEDLDEEAIVANLRELREKGGLELHEFIHELEKMVPPQ